MLKKDAEKSIFDAEKSGIHNYNSNGNVGILESDFERFASNFDQGMMSSVDRLLYVNTLLGWEMQWLFC